MIEPLAWWMKQQPRACLGCNGELVLMRDGDEWQVICCECGEKRPFEEYRAKVEGVRR